MNKGVCNWCGEILEMDGSTNAYVVDFWSDQGGEKGGGEEGRISISVTTTNNCTVIKV